MARIKRDPDDWHAGGVNKRDFQHAHDEPEVPKHYPAKRRKKDTKTWCRGKEGREHVVADKTQPMMPDYACCSPERQKHFAWNHRRSIKCVNCGMDAWNLPDKAKAQVDTRVKLRLEAEEKWCSEGHLMDWESNMTGPPMAFEKDRRFSRNWMDNQYFMWRSRYWERQYCVMCGKEGKTRRRNT